MALAAIQGITEFLPVSSSGHLVLLRRLLGWSDDGGLVFDTVLHAGSLLAILIYFWREWLEIIRAYFVTNGHSEQCEESPPPLLTWLRSFIPASKRVGIQDDKPVIVSDACVNDTFYRRLPWLIVAATIPVVIAGPFLKPLLESEEIMRTARITGLSMIMTALLFLLAECRLRPAAAGKPIGFWNALFIGALQIVALLPGASRSGWTTAAGILSGQPRKDAVRFAFLMAVPAIAGAIIFQARDIFSAPQTVPAPFILLSGVIVSFAVSLAAIHFCLKYFRAHSLRPFAVYLMVIGTIALLIN